jgi:hypothetical protein
MSDITIGPHGETIDDLMDEVSMARIDKLAERFRKSAEEEHPIKAVEVMLAACTIVGETAFDIIPASSQRVALCQAMIKRLVEDLQ